jgi:hypothetical protein
MSIISRMRELESYDDASLVNMIQEGNSRYPQYAVLGEIERRKDLRRITENQIAMQNQPTMSVADESVMQFAQGNQPVAGLQGAQPTMMQEGKKTQVDLNYNKLRSQLSPTELRIVNQAVMQDRTQRMKSDLGDTAGKIFGGGANVSEQALSVLSGGGGNIPIFAGSPEEKKFIEVASNILKNKKASGGLTQMQEGGSTALDRSFDFARNIGEFTGIIDDEGNIDPINAALAAGFFIPGGLAVGALGRGAIGAARSGVGKNLLKSFSTFGKENIPKLVTKKGTPVVTSKKGLEFAADSPAGKTILAGKNPPPITTPRVFDPMRTFGTVGVPSGLALGISNLDGTPTTPSPAPSPAPRELTETEKELQGLQLIQAKSKMEEMQKAKDDDKSLDLISLGGIVLSSRNLAELGANIASFAESKRGRKGTALEQSQASYYETKVDEIKQNLARAPFETLNRGLEVATDTLKELIESNSDKDKITGLATYIDAITRQLADMRGIDLSATGLPDGASIQ